MRTALKIIMVLGVFLAFMSFSVKAGAVGEGEYIVSAEGGEYTLNYCVGTEEHKVFVNADIGAVFDYINTSTDTASVIFAGIEINKALTLCGNYTLSGSLVMKDGADLIIESGRVTLSSLKTELDSGSLRIKEAYVTALESEISSENSSTLVMEHASGSVFELRSGVLKSKSGYAAICLKRGTVRISGGRVESALGFAVENESTLKLSGEPFVKGYEADIKTSVPIYLRDSNDFSGSISVRYMHEFSKGNIYSVFYGANSKTPSSVRLYDVYNTEQSLVYFEEHERIDEKSFAAVYLPHTVEFYVDNLLFKTAELLSGDKLTQPTPQSKSGYSFFGWVKEDGETLCDFAEKVYSSFKLYAEYKLAPPTFSLSSLSFIYDKNEHGLALEELEHPLMEYGAVSCIWERDGVKIQGNTTEIKLKNVNESGFYKCKLYFTVKGESVYVETPEVEVRILKAEVKIPKASPKYYTGTPLSPEIFSTSVYSAELPSGVKVGIYPVKLTLLDSENYVFENGGSVAYSDFEILKADNFFTSELEITDIYEGNDLTPAAAVRFGKITYLYASSYDGSYVSVPPSAVGVYYCRAYVEETENYSELYSSPVSFSVLAERITGISVNTMPNKTSYNAFDIFDPAGLTLTVSYNSSRYEEISAGEYSVIYARGSCFLYSDTYISVAYGGFTVSVPVNVAKAEYDISAISFADMLITYDGAYKTVNYSGTLPQGMDGILLEAKLNGGGIDAGSYIVTLTFFTESPNYKTPEAQSVTLTVLPREREVVFENLNFVYDGSLKCPLAYYTDIDGRKCVLDVEGERSLAGEYTATALNSDGNYKLVNPTCTYKIAKADYDFSALRWNGGDYVYDGNEKSVVLTGLPEGVSVIGYGDNKAKNAGIYNATAVLLYDEHNYNPPAAPTFKWEIKRADYNINGFEFVSSYPVYNGLEQYPDLIGAMPTGLDGIPLEYRFSCGAVNVNDGSVSVEIIFSTESRNYNVPASMYSTVQIVPLSISVNWSGLEFVYDKAPHTPTADTPLASVIVLGGMIDAGNHTALAISLDPNYKIANPNAEYIIKKAANSWSSPLEISDIFEGETPRPTAACIAGEVLYYYTDANGVRLEGIPTGVGIYYAVAASEGDANHEPLVSSRVMFRIMKILPIALNVTLNRYNYTAFERLSESDISASILNNNGSVVLLPLSALTVKYQTASELRRSDEYITVIYGDFTEKLSVSVGKASYNLSGVVWSTAEFVYDGEEKRMELVGLPEGITVLSYIGGVGTNAGEYPVSAVFDYDTYNYTAPNIEGACLRIRKQQVMLPEFPSLCFNGREQLPSLPQNSVYSMSAESGKNAGLYPVRLSLYDSANYEFSGGLAQAIAYYEILPVLIKLFLHDADKYLFEKAEAPEYEIISGALIDGEELMPVFEYRDGKFICTSENPNYSLTYEGGLVKRQNRLSNDGMFILFLILLILLTLALLTVIIVKRRAELADYIARLGCRQRHSSPPPLLLLEAERKPEPAEPEDGVNVSLSVDAARADELITDNLAKDLVRREGVKIYTQGSKREIINIDTLSENFASGEAVDVNRLKEMSLVPYDTAYIKVLARGMIDKPLRVYANSFSLSAVKMLALTGGEAIRVTTVKIKVKKEESGKIDENP